MARWHAKKRKYFKPQIIYKQTMFLPLKQCHVVVTDVAVVGCAQL